jgi:hypothetical protein
MNKLLFKLARRLFGLWLLCVFWAAGADNDDFTPLVNEADATGVKVKIWAPLGSYYRPGRLFPLVTQVSQSKAGDAVFSISPEGAMWIREGRRGPLSGIGSSMTIPREGLPHIFPLHAPALNADLTLTVEKGGNFSAVGAGEELFRASLQFKFYPAGATEQIVLVLSETSPASAWPETWRQVPRDVHALPESYWMWDGVDRVVLSRHALDGATEEALSALRRWLLAGGRLVIPDEQTLADQALRRGLLPAKTAINPSDYSKPAWWLKEGGLLAENLRANAEGRVMIANFRLGFGGGVFRFPGATDEALRQSEMDLSADSLSAWRKPIGSDFRVRPEMFNFFSSGQIAAERSRQTVWWICVGGACLALLVIGAWHFRSRMGAAFAAVGALFLTVFLVRSLEVPGLVSTRIKLERFSLDGRARLRTDWTRLDAFDRSIAVNSICGVNDGVLRLLYRDEEELKVDSPTWVASGDSLEVKDLSVVPGRARLLEAESVAENSAKGNAEGVDLKGFKGGFSLRIPGHFPLAEAIRYSTGRAFLAYGKRSRYVFVLSGLEQEENRSVGLYPGALVAVKRYWPDLTEEERTARRNLLSWVLDREAKTTAEAVLVFLTEDFSGADESGARKTTELQTGLEQAERRAGTNVFLVEVECFGNPDDVVE